MIDDVKERKAFGRPVFGNQAIRHSLAEFKSKVEVARVFTYRSFDLHLAGQLDVVTAA